MEIINLAEWSGRQKQEMKIPRCLFAIHLHCMRCTICLFFMAFMTQSTVFIVFALENIDHRGFPHPIHSYILWINAKTIGSFEFKFSVDIVKTIIIILRSVHFRLTYCSTRPIPISNGKSSNVVYIKAFQSLVLNRTIRQTNILLEFDSLWCVGPFSPFHQNVPLRIHFCVGKSLLYRWL